MTEAPKLNIYQRINEVRRTNEYIKKSKSVDGQYMVVTHDQVTAAIRDDLIKYGVVIEPFMVEGKVIQDTLMLAGMKKNPVIRLESVFDVFFVNVDSPTDRACIRVPAHALDAGDKAPGKALSYAVKAAMLKMFSIETGDREEDRAETGGTNDMPENVFADWKAAIEELKTGDDPNPLWRKIQASCKQYEDAGAKTRLKALLTARAQKARTKGKDDAATTH